VWTCSSSIPPEQEHLIRSDSRSGAWRSGIGRLLNSAVVRHVAGDAPLDEALEEVVLGAPRRYTRLELSERAGLDPDEGKRLWRSLGFAEVSDDAVVFNDRDIAAVRLMSSLSDAGVLEPGVREAVARAVAQSMSRLAEWQVGMLRRLIEAEGEDLTPQQSLQVAASVLPALEELQTYVWRRHLASTVRRLLVAGGGEDGDDDTENLVVGFADMVGFTRTTRRRSTAELSEMIERFGSCTTEVIADGRGRIIKTVGDEVLFVTDDVADGAAIALALQDKVRVEPVLPELRIGLAAGPVLVRYGDVYGEVVNIAARLTSHARPDSVLVDREVADALADDPRFAVRPLRQLAVRGYRHLQPWLLDRSR
jgi:adenylate cyclase